MATRVREFAKTLDHTLLKPEASEADVRRPCREAAYHHFAAVCVLPCHIRLASRELRRTDVKVTSVVSFPFGGDTTLVKVAAVRVAIGCGAAELDVVMNISKFLSGEFGYVAQELASLGGRDQRRGYEQRSQRRRLEGYRRDSLPLSDEMKRLVVQIVAASGADFVKTSTGFGPGGATVEDVSLLREEAPEGPAIKASGGIRSLEGVLDLLDAGASRLGASGSVALMREAENGNIQG